MLNIPFSEPLFTLDHVDDDENLFVYRNPEERHEGIPAMLLTKSDLMELLNRGELARDDIEVFFADKNAANFDMNDLALWMERIRDEQDQYDSWDEDMLRELKAAKETKAFLRKLNELADIHASYDRGAQINVEDGVFND